MMLADFGTSYSKLLDPAGQASPVVVPTRELSATDLRVDLATGHNGQRFARRYVNELIALARGGETLIQEPDYVLLDCGSRDIKYIRYQDGRLADMGWNAECGASMGFTIELLATYYGLDYQSIPVPDKTFNVTCGVLGMSHIFDAVIAGQSIETAVARFVKGIAINAHPDLEHFSGIVPCGITEHGVTSLEDLGAPCDYPSLDAALVRNFERIFGPLRKDG